MSSGWTESDLGNWSGDATVQDGVASNNIEQPENVNDATLPLTIMLQGKPPSLNAWYSGQHWSERKRVRDEWHAKVARNAPDVVVRDYPVAVECEVMFADGRAQYDTENCVTASKLITDGLVEAGVLKGDQPKHVSEVTLRSTVHDGKPCVFYRILSTEQA